MEILKILTQKKLEYHLWSVEEYIIAPPIPLTSFGTWIGIDPGTVNFGLATMLSWDEQDKAKLYQIKFERQDTVDVRLLLTNEVMETIVKDKQKFSFKCPHWTVIEGASFGNNFRQVELAEQRGFLVWWGMKRGYRVQVVPPTTIRKVVFGSGKVKAHEAWQLDGIPKNKQPNDALAALACAYYGMMKEEE